MERPSGVGILRMPRIRIATPVCALVRNDMVYITRSADFSAESKITMSLRGAAVPRKAATWQSASLQCTALRRPLADNSIFINYNLSVS